MAGKNGRTPDGDDSLDALDNATGNDDGEYDALMLLDRLESLEEEMEDLEITTLEELRARIHDLHAELGD